MMFLIDVMLFCSAPTLLPQHRGRDYSRSPQALVCLPRTLSARPGGACFSNLGVREITSFVGTAAEAANYVLMVFLHLSGMNLFDEAGSTSFADHFQAQFQLPPNYLKNIRPKNAKNLAKPWR